VSGASASAAVAGRWGLAIALGGLIVGVPLIAWLVRGIWWGLNAQYAVLIGGPLGPAILAKGIVSSQVASGARQAGRRQPDAGTAGSERRR